MTILKFNLNNLDRSIYVLYLSRTLSFFGSAFTSFALPIYLYEISGSAIHVGLQWVTFAICRILATKVSSRLTFLKSDKLGISLIDFAQGLVLVAFFLSPNSLQIPCAYICNGLIALLSAVQNGFIDSLVGSISENRKSVNANSRLQIASLMENSRYLGNFLGLASAYFFVELIGLRGSLLIDGITFFVSGGLIFLTTTRGSEIPRVHEVPDGHLFKALFSNLNLKFLSLSTAFQFAAVFIFNAIYIQHLKGPLKASNSTIALLYIFQYIFYLASTTFVSKFKIAPRTLLLLGRMGIVFSYFWLSISGNAYHFIAANALLSFALGVVQPLVTTNYINLTPPKHRRVLGSARVALQFSAGAVGALIASIFVSTFGSQYILILGLVVSIAMLVFSIKLFLHQSLQKETQNAQVYSN
jgi:DHA3 family macrolide efflux protein-like MFS transporter